MIILFVLKTWGRVLEQYMRYCDKETRVTTVMQASVRQLFTSELGCHRFQRWLKRLKTKKIKASSISSAMQQTVY